MRTVRTFTVVPALPARLSALREIANNLWWSWNQEAREVFTRIDRDAWEASYHNPIAMFSRVSQKRLKELERDEGFLAHLDRVKQQLDAYMTARTWYHTKAGETKKTNIAYFCAEFGVHECLPIYSGGLGLLAGDHLKAASGLGVPLVGVGLFYHNGYFRQYLNHEGWQQEFLAGNDFYNLPCTLETKDGKPIVVDVDLPGRRVYAQIWRVQVGRVPLYLLDTRIDQNKIEDRAITDQLYGGDHEHRLKQEIVLGVGGIRALRALGIEPQVCHMNEGHSAFLAIERIRILIQEKGQHFHQALEAGIPGNIFTTHTPVPAGNEVFGIDLMDRYFGDWYGKLKIDRKAFLALGRQNPHDEAEPFSMTVLALRTAGHANGVSKLHGYVSRKMWAGVWPEVPVHEVPITSITNGVHIRSYVSDQLNELFVRYCGPRWSYDAAQHGIGWKGPENIPDAEIWRVHERRRSRLVTWARERVKEQLARSGAAPKEIEAADEILDPEALTIGFSRRFATYKRGTLLFSDPARLEAILSDKSRPVQILYAGKAHPKDSAGKQFIQQIYKMARDPRFKNRVIFLEDYDIVVARYLVQGVDVWLNNPRRPLEASGTSGMKAAANGALNCSILDGWWCEGYDGQNGWAIGRGEEYTDLEYQDEVESRALYDLLEKQIIPLFYDRTTDDLPREWIRRMKRAMNMAAGQFSTHRMVREYFEQFYAPSGEQWHAINDEGHKGARDLWDWKMALFQKWAQIRVVSVDSEQQEGLAVGSALKIRTKVHLGPVPPDSVQVQAYMGPLSDKGGVELGRALPLDYNGNGSAPGVYDYQGTIPCEMSGRFGFEIRVLPKNPRLTSPFIPSLITWG
ncbi:MAG TPA: alpha-glucan family phosphorylase [Planctomycetota bacterium]|nr:alpha-glucan family phosphorylase [Planctomycetota bacterium]